jgi:hypothetical protein
MNAGDLHALVSAVAPIVSVAVVDPADKKTWRVDFAPQASQAERAAAQAVIEGIDPDAPRSAHVKAEAGRRILARYPGWKQRNMTARAVELTFKVAQSGALSADEGAETAALQAAWDWIKAVRAASDALEAVAPIPAGFADDIHWPA